MNKILYLTSFLLVGLLSFLLPSATNAQSSFGDASGGVGNMLSPGNTLSAAGTNIATGTIAPSVPLLTLPGTTGRVDLGLRYTAGAGVKVNDVASEVGLGWMLTGTGAITREVRGYPDDSKYGWFIYYSNVQDAVFIQNKSYPAYMPLNTAGNLVSYYKRIYRNYGPNGYRDYGANELGAPEFFLPASQAYSFTNYNWSSRTYGSVSPSAIKGLDTQPDIYNVALPTGGFQFVFDENGNPIPLQAQNIKIEALNLGDHTVEKLLHEFRITTNDGTQYLFGSPNGDNSYKESQSVTTSILGSNSIPSKADYTCIYKWLLKKITYPDGEEVSYQYRSDATYEVSTHNYLQQDYLYTLYNYNRQNGQPYITYPLISSNSATSAYLGWSRAYTVRSTVNSPDCKQLATVSTTQGSVEFTYDAVPRLDVGGSTNALSGLLVRNKQNLLIKSLRLTHHYTDAGVDNTSVYALPYDRYHLLLDKVVDQGAGCDYTQLYEFTYNTTTFFRNTDSKDDWGYLNSNITRSATSVGACARSAPELYKFSLAGRDRSPSLTYSQALVLQNIKQATGGELSFIYELHDAQGYTGTIGGLRIKTLSQYDGISHVNDIVENFIYRANNFSTGALGDRGSYAKLRFIHGDASYTGSYSNKLTDDQIRGDIPSCVTTQNQNYIKDSYYLLRSDASFYTYASDYIDYSMVIIDHGSKGKSKYEFTSWADADRQDFADLNCRLHQAQLSPCPDDPLRGGKRGSTMIPITFSTELFSMGLGLDYPGGGITASFPRRTSMAGQRGLLRKLTQLTTTDNPVAVTTNEYDFAHPDVQLPTINALFAQTDMEVLGFTQYYNYFELYYYQLLPSWAPLVRTTQVIYDQGANGNVAKTLTNTTELSYTNFLPQKTIKYTGAYPGTGQTKYVTEIRYPQNFQGGDADQVTTPGLLRRAGMMGIPVEQEDYLDQATANCTKVPRGASFTEYRLTNNRVLPYRTYAARTGLSCFTAASTSNSSGSWTLIKDINYQLLSTLTGYTADNRPVNTTDQSGITRATIWGYGHTLPIASIINGQAALGVSGDDLLATTAYTSIEEDGVNGKDGDGWNLPLFTNLTEGKTGNRSARIVVSQSPYGVSKPITIPASARHGKLIYSCWVKVPAGNSATGICLIISDQKNGGYNQECLNVNPGQDWQYMANVIDLDAATWTNGLTATDNQQLFVYQYCPYGTEMLVDEVRIHRAEAQMQTVTYTPLVGKTSSTDQNGVTSYYQYDVNNRPRLVLNQNRDIVQRIQSRVVNQSARPSAAFSMPDITMQNCTVQLAADYTACGSASFTWDFGDGTKSVNSNSRQSHDYAQPGTYTVSLLVADPQLGASRTSKVITVNEPYHTDIQISGSTYVDLCSTPYPDPVTLTANVTAGDCQGTINYQWQQQNSNGYWTTVTNGPSISCQVQQGTQYYRCLIVTRYGDNSNSPTLQTISITGYRSRPCEELQSE